MDMNNIQRTPEQQIDEAVEISKALFLPLLLWWDIWRVLRGKLYRAQSITRLFYILSILLW